MAHHAGRRRDGAVHQVQYEMPPDLDRAGSNRVHPRQPDPDPQEHRRERFHQTGVGESCARAIGASERHCRFPGIA